MIFHKYRLQFITLAFFIFLNFTSNTYAQNTLILTDEQGDYPLGLHLAILEDKNKQLTIDDVTSPEFAEKFISSQTKTLNFGNINSAYWLRFTIKNESISTTKWRLEIDTASINYIDFYMPTMSTEQTNVYKIKHTGNILPFSTRDVAHQNFVFNLHLNPKQTRTFYIRLEHSGTLVFTPTIWSLEAFSDKVTSEQFVKGLYYGIMLLMIFSNFIIYVSLWDISYLYYLLTLIFFNLSSLTIEGFAHWYLWADFPHWNSIARPFFISTAILFTLMFTRSFLKVNIYAPKFDRFIIILIGLQSLLTIFSLFSSYYTYFILLSLILIPFLIAMIGASFIAWRNKYHPVLYFITAWTVLLINIFILILVRINMLPTHFTIEHGIHTSGIFLFLLLSLGLTDKVKQLESQIENDNIHLKKTQHDLADLVELLSNRTHELSSTVEKLEIAKTEAETANKTKSKFLAGMSHELRTPLNAVIGFSQLMESNTVMPDTHRKYMTIINRSGNHLLALINNILEMAKIETGQILFMQTSFDLHHVLDNIKNTFSMEAQKKGLQLSYQLLNHIPQYIQADEDKLRQILSNLLSNAIKFTQKGQVILRVGGSSHLFFEIEDTGIGIPESELATIFEAFTPMRYSQQTRGGTGLGLAISRHFVQMMGGDITVSSQVGKGSILRFNIMVKVISNKNIQSETYGHSIVELQPDQPDYRILVVEDNIGSRILLKKMLEMIGFTVREAKDGKEAISIWQEWQPHLICMDMRMPVMDGYEATRQIKATPQGLSTVVFAMTASSIEKEHVAMLAAGCDDIIVKPFQYNLVVDKIAQYLGVRYKTEHQSLASTKNDKSQSQETTENLTIPTRLATIPIEWRDDLHDAIERIDLSMTNEIIAKIRSHDASLANALTDLVKLYRFDVLQDIFEESLVPFSHGGKQE